MPEKKKNTNSTNIGFKSIKNKFNAFTITEIILTLVKKKERKNPCLTWDLRVPRIYFTHSTSLKYCLRA